MFPWTYGHILTHCLHMQRRGLDNKNLLRLQPLMTSSHIHSMANIKCWKCLPIDYPCGHNGTPTPLPLHRILKLLHLQIWCFNLQNFIWDAESNWCNNVMFKGYWTQIPLTASHITIQNGGIRVHGQTSGISFIEQSVCVGLMTLILQQAHGVLSW